MPNNSDLMNYLTEMLTGKRRPDEPWQTTNNADWYDPDQFKYEYKRSEDPAYGNFGYREGPSERVEPYVETYDDYENKSDQSLVNQGAVDDMYGQTDSLLSAMANQMKHRTRMPRNPEQEVQSRQLLDEMAKLVQRGIADPETVNSFTESYNVMRPTKKLDTKRLSY